MFSKKSEKNTAAALTAAAAFAGATLPAAEAEAQLMRPDRTDQQYRDYAYSKAEFRSAGWLKYTDQDTGDGLASGVYIGDGLFLTAAHNLMSEPGGGLRTNISFGFGDNAFSDPGMSFSPNQIFFHPDFSGEVQPHDLALIYDPRAANAGLTEALFATSSISTGEVYDSVSFGFHGVAGDGIYGQDGFIRAGTNDVSTFQNGLIKSNFDSLGSPFVTDSEFSLLAGGSGAPLFHDGFLIGLGNSGTGSSLFGDINLSENLIDPVNYNWIEGVRATVPSPGALPLLAVGGLGLLGRRRRS